MMQAKPTKSCNENKLIAKQWARIRQDFRQLVIISISTICLSMYHRFQVWDTSRLRDIVIKIWPCILETPFTPLPQVHFFEAAAPLIFTQVNVGRRSGTEIDGACYARRKNEP